MKQRMMILFAHITNISALSSFKFVRGYQVIRTDLVPFGTQREFFREYSRHDRSTKTS